MLNTLADRDGPFVGGVELSPFIQFALVGYDKTADRIIRVAPIDQTNVVIVGPERETLRYFL